MRRYRGVIAIALAAAAIAVWLAVSSPSTADSARASTTTTFVPSSAAISWTQAEKAGTTKNIHWGPRCDTSTGHLAIPGTHVPECYAPFHGDDGGATTQGVTATSIKIVAYRSPPSDPLASEVSALSAGAADPATVSKFQHGYVDIMSHYLELYGRHIDLVDFTGTGASNDAVAAVADAETIARDEKPFAVIGGPLLSSAFADTLAANHVICISCAPGEPDAFYAKDAPYVWDLLKNPEQNGEMVNQYIGNRLAGRKAIYAGDPAMHSQTRVFGSVHLKLGPDTESLAGILTKDLARYGVHYAVNESYTDPTELQSTARDLITRLKQAGVTTVVFTGDPIAPGTLTKVATEQGYFPEWVITGTSGIDTNIIPRLLYDPKQWAHAFGPANLFVTTNHPFTAADLWQWYYGTPSPLQGSAATGATTALQILLLPLQGMGPDVTPQRFGDVLFHSPIEPATPTLGQISFGDHGLFQHPDYTAVDDQAEVWWNPDATSVDELGHEGKGSWEWVNGGKRIEPGQWTRRAPDLFDPAHAVVTLDQPATDTTKYRPIRS